MGKERAYSAKPSITSGDQCHASLPVLALPLRIGAGEAERGRQGSWGQARLLGAGEANGRRQPLASCPSHRPNATGPNPLLTRTHWVGSFYGSESGPTSCCSPNPDHWQVPRMRRNHYTLGIKHIVEAPMMIVLEKDNIKTLVIVTDKKQREGL